MVGLYDYMKAYCVCDPCVRYINALDASGEEIGEWPAMVYDLNGGAIAVAYNKEEYINIWNSNAVNRAVGKLEGWYGPFEFAFYFRCIVPDAGGETVAHKILLESSGGWLLEDGSYWLHE